MPLSTWDRLNAIYKVHYSLKKFKTIGGPECLRPLQRFGLKRSINRCGGQRMQIFDRIIAERFSDIHAKAIRCELFAWRKFAEGRLAEIILLDQISRNLCRDSAKAFENDALALALAQDAISTGADQKLTAVQRAFLYMPLMHSESLLIHEVAVDLYESNHLPSFLDFEIKHQLIIKQFGRYPHRNAALGRQSTQTEIEFLKRPESFF